MTDLVQIKKDKNLIINNKTYNYLNPDFVYIPYEKGYKLNIKTNDKICKECVLLSNDDKYIYSPVSGIVIGATEMLINNQKVPSIIIENDFKEKTEKLNAARKKINNYTSKEVNELLNKYNAYKGNLKGSIILVNGIDYDVYEATRSSILSEYIAEILETIDALYEIFSCESSYLAIKNNDSNNVEKLVNHIGTYPNIELKLMPDLYPIGYKDILIKELNLTKSKDEIIYLTVEEVLAIYNVLRKKRAICEKLVTIGGDLITEGKVLNVKIGTTLKDILLNNFKIEDINYHIVVNGLLSGYEVDSLDMVITPDVRSIFINSNNIDRSKRCINCGMCHTKCPVGCDPRSGSNLENCIECGLCTYVCPAKRNFKKERNQS